MSLQALLPGAQLSTSAEEGSKGQKSGSSEQVYAHHMVRTDSRDQKLEAFFPKSSASTSSADQMTSEDCGTRLEGESEFQSRSRDEDVQAGINVNNSGDVCGETSEPSTSRFVF